ncbi:helix-turn-helix domain-containing protein [Streptomyces aureoverticillatus]|uniref:helix-turn-helix domain-containing protein n=1 Tax=Streptomyces aureoverticillatus TaxID=66871 RepID=UPI0013D914FB|nr:helix-turn-helix transcriptional regulator [Streptomyces aureoverticillatus]QIB45115.1 helix-turn-helix domain-containing protein [Streptomyces aureoverticillatus]
MHFGERGSRSFGALLRFYREQAGLTQEALGAHVGYSKSQVAMVERGERPPKGKLVEIADEVLSARGALLVLAEKEFEQSGLQEWTEDFLEHEKRALSIYSYQDHVMPGLLQTGTYARAVFNCVYPPLDDDEIDKRVANRLARQQLFMRKPAAVLNFIVEESALTRPLGGKAVIKEQLHNMVEFGKLRHVEIQVMPHDRRTHAGLMGAMILLETAERRQLAYIEGHRAGYFVSEQPDLGNLQAKYGILRTQALPPEDSARLIEKVACEL